MPSSNTFEITDVVAVSLALMRSNSVLGECVMRDAEAAFTGGRGDVVRVRTPKRRVAQNFNGTTVYTKVEEGHVQVKLTDEPTVAAAFTTKDMTLNIESFGEQVLKPQMDAVSAYVEKSAAAALLNAASKATGARAIKADAKHGEAGHVVKMLTAAAADFTRREIPAAARFLAIGPDVQNILLDVEQLQKVNEAGDSQALRNATMGELFGFRVVVSPYLDGAVAFHKTAYALAVRAPSEVQGGARSVSAADNQYALRVTMDFDPSVKSEVSIVDTLCGVATIDPARAIAFTVTPPAKA
ncbi:P22 phage major capsid protein family protein [Kitasatospora sp. NPDC092286]|uniref:P22 phage major capsid protein family protein n=1 Tax=Kitasatospora sp. NPDC092286 TaxID=3364087 RepID=UPI0037F4F28F